MPVLCRWADPQKEGVEVTAIRPKFTHLMPPFLPGEARASGVAVGGGSKTVTLMDVRSAWKVTATVSEKSSPLFTDVKTDVTEQRGRSTRPRSSSKEMMRLALKPRVV